MAHYWGRFVPSVINGASPGEWEHFRNAENPARALKGRARDKYGSISRYGATFEERNRLVEFNEADQSAIMLMWLSREQPNPDKAPDEVWHLTNRYGLIRTTWSAIVDPVGDEPEDDEPAVHEPSLDDHDDGEISVISWDDHGIQEIWRPPSLEELAERKVILIGDQRPLTAGAYSERQVERPNLRRACPDCHTVPSPFTLECRC